MPEIEKEKTILREKIRSRITAMGDPLRKKSDQQIFYRILELPEYQAAETIFAYASVRKEISTCELLRHAAVQGKRVALPRINKQTKQMLFAVVSGEQDLTEGVFGIPEPKQNCLIVEPDQKTLIFVPALCYDQTGVRLGQGGGYYDRWLAPIRSYTVGLCRAALLQTCLPHLPHDVAVNCVVTEEKILRLPKKPQFNSVVY